MAIAVALAMLALPAVAGAAKARTDKLSPRVVSAVTKDRDANGRIDTVSIRYSERVGLAASGSPALRVEGYEIASVAEDLSRPRPKAKKKARCPKKKKRSKKRKRKARSSSARELTVSAAAKKKKKSKRKKSTCKKKKRKRKRKKKARSSSVGTSTSANQADVFAVAAAAVRQGRAAAKKKRRSKAKCKKSTRSRKTRKCPKRKRKALKPRRAITDTLILTVKENGAPDTDAKPAISYSRPKSRKAKVSRVMDAAGNEAFGGVFRSTADGAGPLLLAARTADGDGNGRLDAVTMAFSEQVAVAGSPAGAVAVAGRAVSRLAPAGGASVTAGVVEGPLVDTGERPVVSVAGGAAAVADASGNPAIPGSTLPADSAPPILTGAVTVDAGGTPGAIDRMDLIFSEAVGHPGGGSPVTVDGYTVGSLAAPGGAGVSVHLAEKGLDSGARPGVSYRSGLGTPIVDAAGNGARDASFTGTRDGVAPRMLGATTADASGNGRIDRIEVSFSEPLGYAGQTGGAYPFSVGGYGIASIAPGSGSKLTISLVEGVGYDTGARPGVSYAPGSGASVTDLAGQLVAAGSVAAAEDGAGPAVIGAKTGDSDLNGKIDRLEMTFSEAMTHLADTDGDYPLSVAGYSLSGGLPAVTSSATVTVTLTEGGDPDTGATPAVTYQQTSSQPIADIAGNQPPSKTFSGLTRDDASPQLLSASTRDGDSDGRIDSVVARFSETVQVSGAPIAIAGYTVTGTSASAANVTATIAEGGSDDTGATPTLTYAPAGSSDVRDIAAPAGADEPNLAPPKILVSADGAGPAIIRAATGDSNNNGKIDTLGLTFSEPVTHASQSSGPFPLEVSGRTITQVGAPSGGDLLLAVSIVEGSYDSGARPPVSHTGAGSGPIRDAAGNQPPNAAVTPADEAKPVLVSAAAADASANGKIDTIDTVWSEAINHSANAGPNYPFTVSDPAYAIAAGGIPAASGSIQLPVPMAEGASADRDKSPHIAYSSSAAGEPVLDAAGNEAPTNLTAMTATRVCNDPAENNATDDDTWNTAAAANASQRSERICGGDPDWFAIELTSGMTLRVLASPGSALNPRLTLFSAAQAADESSFLAQSIGAGVGENEQISHAIASTGTYYLKVDANELIDGSYCLSITTDGTEPLCGAQPGDLLITEVMAAPGSSGLPEFVEIHNRSGLDQRIQNLTLTHGGGVCNVDPVGGELTVPHGGRIWGAASGDGRDFTCENLSIADSMETLTLRKSDTVIDHVPLSGIPVISGKSIQTKPTAETGLDANDSAGNWCYTYWDSSRAPAERHNASDTRGAANDGCNQYRLNELLWNAPDADDGKTFIELRGNAAVDPADDLLAGWKLVFVEGRSSDTNGIASAAGQIDGDLTLPSGQSKPGTDGIFVIADAAGGVTQVANADITFEDADPENDLDAIQLLRPGAPDTSANCGLGLPGYPFEADVFGHTVGAGLSVSKDSVRNCNMWEGQVFADPGTGSITAQRLNGGRDTEQNSVDFDDLAAPGTPGTP